MSNAISMGSLLNEFFIWRFLIMKKLIPPIEKLEELSWRYDGPISQEQIATINAEAWQVPTCAGTTADLRFW